MLDKLKDLGKYIAEWDNGSGDAAAIIWGVGEIERLRAALEAIIQDKATGEVSKESWALAINALRAGEQGAQQKP